MAWADQYQLMVYCDTHDQDKPIDSYGLTTFTENFDGPNKRDVFKQAKQAGWVLDYLPDGTPRGRCAECVKNPPEMHPSRIDGESATQSAKQGEPKP